MVSKFVLFFSDNKALFVISMSDNGAQIYELVAQTVSEKTVYVLDIAACSIVSYYSEYNIPQS
ncbi:hypothetical protein Celaphus_00009019 [Cervus elaphus hippelaphus]|uniref:ARHGEF1-like PH domain-containing protein n=1 Tax=Cervus elaphus hippelaphus TaxID=46360 RepID=A0A212DHQ2_CEREH|nr:hypothetical protein Celaphus_00009019 [Cervus elaphus hippelaphus]